MSVKKVDSPESPDMLSETFEIKCSEIVLPRSFARTSGERNSVPQEHTGAGLVSLPPPYMHMTAVACIGVTGVTTGRPSGREGSETTTLLSRLRRDRVLALSGCQAVRLSGWSLTRTLPASLSLPPRPSQNPSPPVSYRCI